MKKVPRWLIKSQVARLKQAQEANTRLALLLQEQASKFGGWRMQLIREDAANLIQCIHEYSALQNVIESLETK